MTDKKFLEYIQSQGLYNFRDKQAYMYDHIQYMLTRTQSMFKWSGLPETIPENHLEEYIQMYGFACIAKANDGKLYAFWGGLGGELDAYYDPTICTVANPYLKLSKTYKIDEDCVIIRNDPFFKGIIPLLQRYGSQLAENDLSMWMASINTRVQAILSACDDDTRKAAEKYIDDVYEGKLSVIGKNPFLDDDLKADTINSSSKTSTLGDLIEYHQYLKASEYNELGLNANYNMKREALNSAESSINDDILFPLVDIMLKFRKKGAEAVNKMFGTNISVELNSSWKDNKREEEAEIEALNPESDETPENKEEKEEPEETSEEEQGKEKEGDKDDNVA